MKKPIMIVYKEKKYVAGERIFCDRCMKTIFDSRYEKESQPYYSSCMQTFGLSAHDLHYDLCGTNCARSLFDDYLKTSKETLSQVCQNSDFKIETMVYKPQVDYNTLIPEEIPINEYKNLQREAR